MKTFLAEITDSQYKIGPIDSADMFYALFANGIQEPDEEFEFSITDSALLKVAILISIGKFKKKQGFEFQMKEVEVDKMTRLERLCEMLMGKILSLEKKIEARPSK
mmetsp:Transcript_7663/g.6928  ORF Transcript_7663/g.6928 Transcript_7663/m.6928 type:complete len:106 (+) Transcript_7663:90-407(+)